MEEDSPVVQLQRFWDSRKRKHHWRYEIEQRLSGYYAVTVPHRWQGDTGDFLGNTVEEASKTLRFYSE